MVKKMLTAEQINNKSRINVHLTRDKSRKFNFYKMFTRSVGYYKWWSFFLQCITIVWKYIQSKNILQKDTNVPHCIHN